MALGRITGIALLSLGMACWPGAKASGSQSPWPVLTYNTLVASYLFSLGLGGESVGVLLWPAVVVHGLMALLLVGVWFKGAAGYEFLIRGTVVVMSGASSWRRAVFGAYSVTIPSDIRNPSRVVVILDREGQRIDETARLKSSLTYGF